MKKIYVKPFTRMHHVETIHMMAFSDRDQSSPGASDSEGGIFGDDDIINPSLDDSFGNPFEGFGDDLM